MRAPYLTPLLLGALLAPAGILGAAPEQDRNELFESFAKQIIEGYLRANPEAATQLGDHRFDGQLSDLGADSRRQQVVLAKRARMVIESIPDQALSRANQVDKAILLDKIGEYLFDLEEGRSWENNPMVYNPGGALDGLLSRDFAPLPERLRAVQSRLQAVPAMLATARLNLVNPPRIYTETAIRQLQGTLGLVRDDVTAAATQAGMKDQLAPAQAQAAKALEDFIGWLKADLLPRSNGDFRVGKERFAKQLRYTLNSDLSMAAILQRAEAGLKATQAEMATVAAPLFATWFPGRKESDPKVMIKAVLDKLTELRPNNDTIVGLATEDLKTTTEFVRAKGLVSVPAEPLKIIVMPEYQRGVAVAYCDSPGGLETTAPPSSRSRRPRPTGVRTGSRASSGNTTTPWSRTSPSTRPCPGTTCSWPIRTPTRPPARCGWPSPAACSPRAGRSTWSRPWPGPATAAPRCTCSS
jgi:hypothetical protein